MAGAGWVAVAGHVVGHESGADTGRAGPLYAAGARGGFRVSALQRAAGAGYREARADECKPSGGSRPSCCRGSCATLKAHWWRACCGIA